MLLVAAGLLTGVSSAWADWTTVYTQDYTNSSTYDTGWSNGNTSRIAWGQMTRTDLAESVVDKTAMKIYMTNLNNGAAATFTGLSSVTAYTSSTKYKIEFDFGLTTSNNQSPSFVIYAGDNSTELINFAGVTGSAATCTFSTKAGKKGSFYCPQYSYNTHSLTDGAPSVFNHVLIEADENNGTTITISGASTETQTVVVSDDMEFVGKMVWNSKKYMTAFAIDNLTVSIYSETEIVPDPTAAVTAVNGEERTITMSVGTGSADGTVVKYYTEKDVNDDPVDLTTYTVPFTTSTATTIYYYAESTSGATSSEQQLTTTAGTANTLSAPSIQRTGASTYNLTATAKVIDGLTIAQTLHWTINGGAEQTGASPATINNVDGDIVAWATADGVTKSENLEVTYVAPFAGATTWSYNLNSYPSTYSCTAIADAIDTETETTLNETTVYNLKNIEKPNLFVENSTGWLLRNQASSAFKCQSAQTNIVINNLTTSDFISINAVKDGGSYSISGVDNGAVAYYYNNTDYFITPTADGSVRIKFNTGVSINTITVYSTTVSKTISAAGYATFCSPYALDFSGTGLTAYIAKVDGDNVTFEAVTSVPANTGVLLKGDADTYEIPVVASSTTNVEDNAFIGTTTGTTAEAGSFVLMNETSGVGFYKTMAEFTVGANTAYLPSGATARSFIGFDFDEATAIKAVESVKAENGAFNLRGQRVKNLTKGLYIVNGKKVVK